MNGVNLNRCYTAPGVDRHPGVYAAKAVMLQMARTLDAPPSHWAAQHRTVVTGSAPCGLWAYLDLHGFSARKGGYFLGNVLPPALHARCVATVWLRVYWQLCGCVCTGSCVVAFVLVAVWFVCGEGFL